LSERVPARRLVGPGLLLVGAGLLLMSGLDAGSDWTDLIAGFVVAGIGSGLVNPPLASTAVGVVSPAEAGMASGANSTLRQIGIAVGIAVYGTTFTNQLHAELTHHLAGIPDLAHHVPAIATGVTQGQADTVLATTPATARPELAYAIHAAFTAGLNDLLLISGILALTGGILGLLLIRSKDFHR
jgi:hypothetical protein